VRDGLKDLESQMATLLGETESHATECDKVGSGGVNSFEALGWRARVGL
jgi:hypothetical protein